MTKLSWCALAIALALAACGQKQEQPAQPQSEAAAPAEQSVPAQDAEPLKPPGEGAKTPGDGETVDAGTATTSPVASAVANNTPAPPSGSLKNWQAGVNFTAYPVAQPVGVLPGEVEVIEGFWYGCGHCYSLEPRLEQYEKTKPAWIKVKRVPVIWNEVTREDARLFYTIESLGLLDKLHAEVYREIHKNGRPLVVMRDNRVDQAATERAARNFLVSRGVSEADFARHYRTFSAENKLRQAENLARRYRLDHTPMVVVQGKYVTDVSMAGGPDRLFDLIGDLAARERGGN